MTEIKNYSTAELSDGIGEESAVMDAGIKPMAGRNKIAGVAFTVSVPKGEGGIIATAIEQLKKGEVLVIAGGGSITSSYWGDHRSYCAKMMQAEGVVIDGAFRDIEECEEIGFPVFAKGVHPKTATKTGEGQMQIPVECGGVTVKPGDIIVGDRNGVIVIPPKSVSKAIEGAREKVAAQQYTMELMKSSGKVIGKIIRPE